MSARHANALSTLENRPPIASLCQSLDAAQREMLGANYTPGQVTTDPAVRLLASALVSRFSAGVLDHPANYDAVHRDCHRQAMAGSAAHRAALDAREGGGDPAALALSLARHAGGTDCPEAHAGLRLIAHKLATVCKVQALSYQEMQSLELTCRAARSADSLSSRFALPKKAAPTP